MNLKLDLNTAQFRAAAKDAVNIMGANAELLIKEEGRLFLKEWRMRTPPFSKGYGQSESASADKKAGEKAVRGDLRRLATPLDAAKIKIPRLKELIEKNDEAGLQAFFDNVKSAAWRNRRMVSANSYKSLHKVARNSRGRIRKDMRNAVIGGPQVLAYTKEVLGHVGFAKGTFNAAAMKLGARLPSYVAKQGPLGGYSEGRAPSFYIEMSGSSNVPSAQTAVDQSISIRGKKLEAEVKRIMRSFAATGKIQTRRKSFNQ
jgi:hypothetical protein